MAAADLPSDLPVPAPAGGEINPNLSVSDGQSLAVDYPPGMFDAVAAFYDAWFAEQGISVEPSFGSSDSRRWRVQIDGRNIEVGLSPATNKDVDTLFILYP